MADLPEATTTPKQPRYIPSSTWKEVVQHSSACLTTQEHTQPAVMLLVDVTGGSHTTMSIQFLSECIRDDDAIARVNFITQTQNDCTCVFTDNWLQLSCDTVRRRCK